MRKCIACALALGLAAVAAGDEDYRLFVSGWPADDPSASAASPGVPLVTGTLSAPAAAAPLETRFRTAAASAGTDLLSTKFTALYIVIR